MPSIQTVLGPLDAAEVSGVLHHEHVLSLSPGPWLTGGSPDFDAQQIQLAVQALRPLLGQGINTVVDLSPYGVVGRSDSGSNVTLLQEISRQAGIHIVAGSAVYLEAMSPCWTQKADLAAITERFIADGSTGIGDTTVVAGIFGEQATGLNEITRHEEKCLRAAARAQLATGRSMTTHTTHGSMALEQIDILRQEGVDLGRVLIGHMDTHHNLEYVREVLTHGVSVGFDTIGKQNWDFFLGPPLEPRSDGPFIKNAYHQSDLLRASWLVDLLADGFEDHILLAQDLTGAEVYLNPDTHGQWGYGYLSGPFCALLSTVGVTDDQIQKMMHANPVRLLSC